MGLKPSKKPFFLKENGFFLHGTGSFQLPLVLTILIVYQPAVKHRRSPFFV